MSGELEKNKSPEYKQYSKKGVSEMTPWTKDFNMDGVILSEAEIKNGSPKKGDMIARDPNNHKDKRLVSEKYASDHLELVAKEDSKSKEKSLHNTDTDTAKSNVKDIKTFGGDLFKLISKASSQKEGWMKSTKGMAIKGVGVVIQVTTQQKNHDGTYVIAEAITTVNGAIMKESKDSKGNVIGRYLSKK